MKKKNLGFGFKNKKGNAVIDGIMILLVIFTFIIITFFGKYIIGMWNEDISADDDMSNFSKEMVQTHNTRYVNFFDGLFMFFFILIWALAVVASFKIDSHPIFFIFTVILLIVVFIIAAYLGNVYEEIAAIDELATISPQFPMANWIMTHLLLVAVCVGFSIVLVLFGKNRLEG